MKKAKERSRWTPVKEFMGEHKVRFGRHHSFQLYNSPRRILHMMSYYKFASKIIGRGKHVLDVGCGEGLGTWLLAVECGRAEGLDLDREAVEIGRQNWPDPRIKIQVQDFLQLKQKGSYDAVVNFDVIEHILPENVGLFWKKISDNLKGEGIAVVGTPNSAAEQYASPVTRSGHVNLYSGEKLEAEMKKHFKHVLMFGGNDEVVHTGFLPMAHYLIAVGCHKLK
ncbi:MAG: class I SAM-dependent methyltransferase [Candidatus Margulisbacteria bacterium]|nr:class I SAM-dependent methyltransferase [Candidatus Margulisiibacteriota bacterium]